MLNHIKKFIVFLDPKESKELTISKIQMKDMYIERLKVPPSKKYRRFDQNTTNIIPKYSIVVTNPTSAINITHGFSNPILLTPKKSELNLKESPIPFPDTKFSDIILGASSKERNLISVEYRLSLNL